MTTAESQPIESAPQTPEVDDGVQAQIDGLASRLAGIDRTAALLVGLSNASLMLGRITPQLKPDDQVLMGEIVETLVRNTTALTARSLGAALEADEIAAQIFRRQKSEKLRQDLFQAFAGFVPLLSQILKPSGVAHVGPFPFPSTASGPGVETADRVGWALKEFVELLKLSNTKLEDVRSPALEAFAEAMNVSPFDLEMAFVQELTGCSDRAYLRANSLWATYENMGARTPVEAFKGRGTDGEPMKAAVAALYRLHGPPVAASEEPIEPPYTPPPGSF